jgi:EpsI family protein
MSAAFMNSFGRFGLTCLLLGSTLALSRFATSRESQPLREPLTSIDRQIGPWMATDDPPLAPNIVASLAATSYLSRTYRRGTQNLSLFVAFYANQRAGESMHSPKHCLPGGGWEMVGYDQQTVLAGRDSLQVNNYLLLKPGERMRMLYWYQGPERVVASEYKEKLYLIWDSIRRGETSGSIVRVLLPDDPAALADGLAFSREIIPRVARCFGR